MAPGNGRQGLTEEVLHKFVKPEESVSCGGGYFPTAKNTANLSTVSSNIILPTEQYSVMIFKTDGSAVIYSDLDPAQREGEMEEENERF